MKNYQELLQTILNTGETRDDRTGVGTRSIFGSHLRFDLGSGFPAVTTKKLAWRACVGELIWFLEGSTNERRLAEITHGSTEGRVTIWTPNALGQGAKLGYTDGELGPVYGKQWRNFGGVDQVAQLIDGLKNDPSSRRHIINAWNVPELEQMSLPPCHVMSQFYVSQDSKLSCHMYQRSVDVFLGLPFNIASYALLTHMIAQVCDLGVGELVISTGDTHIYNNHIEQVREQLTRVPLLPPTLKLNPEIRDINKFTMNDIELVGYQSYDAIRAPMAV
jgi:thymidylate synthase